jgi:uncharacterized protein YndB with AHSA1/START domain
MREFTHTLSVTAAPAAVLDAFFSHDALAAWWHVTRSLCTPRPLGSYALEWPSTEWHDDTLGRLGGTFRGTVIEYRREREFFVADAYWLPPDGDPIGPMALEARCSVHGHRTQLQVRQSGWEDSRRWNRYYEVLAADLPVALDALRGYVEKNVVD